MRASGSDDKVRLIPPVQFSLEEALEYIKEDEYVEVTPKAMRMRKVFLHYLGLLLTICSRVYARFRPE